MALDSHLLTYVFNIKVCNWVNDVLAYLQDGVVISQGASED